jgi:multidrug resistance efflux pump
MIEGKGRRPLRIVIVGVLLVALPGAYFLWPDSAPEQQYSTSFTVARDPLTVSVLESGSIEAFQSIELKSEVQGETKILSIVDEGYYVSSDDVAEEKVLVELDATNLIERQTEQELQYQNSLAGFTEAREQFEIQRNQNESDLRQAELDVKFARMDFEKYMGSDVAGEIVARLPEPEPEEVDLLGTEPAVPPRDLTPAAQVRAGDLVLVQAPMNEPISAPSEIELPERKRPEIDFNVYADVSMLGDGEAGQTLRKREDDLVLAEKEVGIAESQLEGTQRLFEKEFVTKNELENDEMVLKRNLINLESARTSKELFIKYEFPKEAERLLSAYEEAQRKLVRTRKMAISQLAQAEAKYRSAEASFRLQQRKREELAEQIANCIIRATAPGLVIYGAGDNDRWRDNERIEEGASVRERQVIITIPDMSRMAVNVKVHEAYVEKIQRGQHARIKVDANRSIPLTGEVVKISVLPDSQNRWLNPDLKVYSTQISIDQSPDWLKPGMSAEVEIIVETLEDVIQVPLQAVIAEGRERVCYIASVVGPPERRVVETGAFNDMFVEVKSGISEGERVLLRAPILPDKNAPDRAEEEEKPAAEETAEQGGGDVKSGAAAG